MSERLPGEGIIRLRGPAIVRPCSEVSQNGLTPAAIELMTGVRLLSAGALSRSSSLLQTVSNVRSSSTSHPVPLRNYEDSDWWGE